MVFTEDKSPETVPVLELSVQYNSPLPRATGRDDDEHLELEAYVEAKFASPYDWPAARKHLVLAACCVAPMLASYSASAYEPCKEQLMDLWGVDSTLVAVGITTFTTGFAVGPMFMAPFSEIRGRKPVFVFAGVLFVVGQIACAVSRTYAGMLVARFFAGVGSSTYSTLIGGVISDMYRAADRGTPMAIFSGGALFGMGFGSFINGFIAQNVHWSWVFWSQAIANAVVVVLFLFAVPETREAIILVKKTVHLQGHYSKLEAEVGSELIEFELHTGACGGEEEQPAFIRTKRIYWRSPSHEEGMTSKKLGWMIAMSLLRPFHLLFTEPVVFFFSLWATFSWSILFMTVAAVPEMFTAVYGFSLSQANATFASACIFSVLAALVAVWHEKRWSSRGRSASSQGSETVADPEKSGGGQSARAGATSPEQRLRLASVMSLLLPFGLFVFGWTARPSVHWMGPTVGLGLATAGIYSVYLAVFNYLADGYGTYASSALAAQSFGRNAVGGVLPLLTGPMYDALGYGPGCSLLGGIGLVLTAGCWVLMAYGPQIRARSRVARKLREAEEEKEEEERKRRKMRGEGEETGESE